MHILWLALDINLEAPLPPILSFIPRQESVSPGHLPKAASSFRSLCVRDQSHQRHGSIMLRSRCRRTLVDLSGSPSPLLDLSISLDYMAQLCFEAVTCVDMVSGLTCSCLLVHVCRKVYSMFHFPVYHFLFYHHNSNSTSKASNKQFTQYRPNQYQHRHHPIPAPPNQPTTCLPSAQHLPSLPPSTANHSAPSIPKMLAATT